MISDAQFGRVQASLEKTGGFSASYKNGSSPKAGYMVSLPGLEKQVSSADNVVDHIKGFVSEHATELSKPGRFIGGWDNGKGEVSLDVSQNITPKRMVTRKYGADVADVDARTSAFDLIAGRNQEAGWDVKRQKELPNPGFDPDGRRGNV